MIVSGGSGITYALSTVEDLLESRVVGAGRTRVVELVWSVQNPCRHISIALGSTCTHRWFKIA